MVIYVDCGCQTEIAGLCEDAAPVPLALKKPQAPIETPTPPDDMALDKTQFPTQDAPVKPYQDDQLATNLRPSMLLKRKSRPPMIARISLPALSIGNENPLSPPPTEAVMSPLPAANKLHAGHTPIIPRAMSPLPPSEGPASPGDEGLSGPLTLPPQPGDGTEETIPLHVLAQELEKLALQQERTTLRSGDSEPEPDHEDDAAPLSRKASRGSQRNPSDTVEVVDGVILKKPKMNMGAPLGQA
ncbi:hypothetical protein BU23DRAFT_556546 [Bimuria novae-zelandiae CBS 107.79]|uniref:Uncharacterized protein n=1 Tax=Bimuria novae-zelandiae CBS 107.79 TaxID=1447943 RepID=A0A6A5V097_9PLEO|nr:hypothetical protein BU23DRAFT_556546 [Bimuria novae-zelandiae CBS 107.79]